MNKGTTGEQEIDEVVEEGLLQWGDYLRNEPGINLGVRLQQLQNGAPPKRYTKIPSYIDDYLQWFDMVIKGYCSKEVQACLLAKYMGGKSNTVGALMLSMKFGTYKERVKEGRIVIRTVIDTQQKMAKMA